MTGALQSLALALSMTALAGAAGAATFNLTVNGGTQGPGGNYCGGEFGDFVNGGPDTPNVCKVGDSPWIVKYEYDDDEGVWNLSDFNTYFGDEADFVGIGIELVDRIWQWTYLTGGSDAVRPGITAFSAKGGTSNNLYEWDGDDPFTGTGPVQFAFPQGNSNITFFDSEVAPIPLPAAGLMLAGAVGGLAALRRRKAQA
jgi:hypothetical protein